MRLFVMPVFIIFCLCVSSIPAQAQQPTNYAYLYDPGSEYNLHPQYKIYHDKDSTSLLIGKIQLAEFIGVHSDSLNKMVSQVKVQYIMKEYDQGNKIIWQISDSATRVYYPAKNHRDDEFYFALPIQAKKNKKYAIVIKTTDILNDNNFTHFFLTVDKSSEINAQNFNAIWAVDNSPLFAPNIVTNATFRLQYNKPLDSIYVFYFADTLALPKAPNTPQPMQYYSRPDSVWKYPFNKTTAFSTPYKGMYVFAPDSNQTAGMSILNLGNDFPQVTTPEEMIESAKYIMTTDEFTKIQSEKNKKLAIDNFWLARTDNIDRSRELLRIYYNRVMLANHYFTTDRPGWKTERGMIYIIYGLPDQITKTPDMERWFYSKDSREFGNPVTFTFSRASFPYNPNVYELVRYPDNVIYWRNTIQSWRNGNILKSKR